MLKFACKVQREKRPVPRKHRTGTRAQMKPPQLLRTNVTTAELHAVDSMYAQRMHDTAKNTRVEDYVDLSGGRCFANFCSRLTTTAQ